MRYFIAAALLFISQLALSEPRNEDVVKMTLPKVVMIEVTGTIDDYETIFSTYTTPQTVTWLGSGSLISADGIILSCDHLFIRKLQDRRILVKMHDGKKYMALLLSENNKKDLSILKIFPLRKLPYFELGKKVARGQKVFAFGAPLGINKTVSFGYVQNVDVGVRKFTMHSASINPGNSGGPLVTEDGKLVGVNVQILMANFFMRAEGMAEAVSLTDITSYLKD